MKKRAAIIAGTATIVMSTILATPAFAGTVIEEQIIPEAGIKVTTEITYDENGRKVITTHSSPINEYEVVTETEFRYNMGEILKPIPAIVAPLAEAPEVGTVLAHIIDETKEPWPDGTPKFTEPYSIDSVGQCAWYAAGRYHEIYGIELPYLAPKAKDWYKNAQKFRKLKTSSVVENVPEYSIAVYEPTEEYANYPGHVVFIEYVERDADGKPIYIYYTDANGVIDLRKGKYDEGYDGIVQKDSFDDFKNPYGLKLIGYILPQQ